MATPELQRAESTTIQEQPMPALLDNNELINKFSAAAKRYYSRFFSQRNLWEITWKVSDYMYKAAQNISITQYEKQKGANLIFADSSNTERAQTGSTLFHRQVRQLAAQGASVQFSRDVPFSYKPIVNDEAPDAYQRGEDMANQLNILARWTMKHDNFNKKSIEFWHQIYKNGNVPIVAEQIVKKQKRKVREPVYSYDIDEYGQPRAQVAGYQEVEREFIVDNYPSIKVLPTETVYADMYIGSIQGQNCIVIPSLKNYSELVDYARIGIYDMEKVQSLAGNEFTGKYRWDGVTGEPLTRFKAQNNNTIAGDTWTGQFLVWDVFMRAPIADGKWDDQNAPQIWWGTFVGNDIATALCVRLDENPDPDNEFPLEIIHAIPDDPDLLYHTSPAQIVRSNYSVECTLKNQAIDNAALINRPPLKIKEGEVRGRDFEFTPGKVFIVDNDNSISEFNVRDTTQPTTNMLNWMREDTMSALATDKPFMGESFGARTSATESSNIYKNSVQPHMVSIRYILDQYLGFYAKKLRSYWQAFAIPGQVVAITGQGQFQPVRPANIYGEFDVEIDVVDEFEDDIVQKQNINDAIRIFSTSPQFAQVVDASELAREWFKRYKFDYTKIVTGRMDVDAEYVASNENVTLLSGAYTRPMPGQNHQVHLSKHKGERIRYNGIEDQFPNVQLLDQHIAETEYLVQLLEQQAAAAQQQQMSQNQEQTAGQAAGNQIAGAIGAQ